MGCSYDRFTAVVPCEENAQKLVDIFMDVLKEDLACSSPCFIRKTDNGEYRISAEEEPLFNEMRQGDQLRKFVFAYLKAVPDMPFHASYRATYDNCDAVDTTDYSYKDGKLDIEETHSEGSFDDESAGYCYNCGFTWDPYEETIDVCPECGEEFETDESIWNYHFRLIDGEFTKIPE